jgi:hypothetical protein
VLMFFVFQNIYQILLKYGAITRQLQGQNSPFGHGPRSLRTCLPSSIHED